MTRPGAEPFRVDKDDRGTRVLPAGVTEWDLRSGRYRRLFKGVYVGRKVTVTPLLLARAALLLVDPRSVVSHQSAARIWGAVVPDDGLAHLSCVGRRPQVRGLAAHRVSRGGQKYVTFRGLRVTTPAQTFLDLAADLGLVDLVVLGDSLVKAERVTPAQLVEAAAAFRGRSRRRARRAAGLVRAEVDSPMETRLRLLLVLAGLPEPVINHKIHWPGGRVRFRFDLSYPEYRLVIEYDGRQHAESDDQWGIDLDRREWMDGGKWRLIVVRATGIYTTPAHTLQRVIGAMRDQGMPVPTLSDEWRQHFPSRADDVAEPA
ncbi:hypothetical protein [Intrasporangium sp.]|uniref:hypothetical protein n=1 Tax=Intrasporangium sp. TaxID=1925024 RepID=UPI00293B48CB|nr:hypothetical protein [Intrasporangium sp.]MDV3221737.1 hypothetical protein [Intrasporangium sp.]